MALPLAPGPPDTVFPALALPTYPYPPVATPEPPVSVDLTQTPRHSTRVVSRMVSGEHILVPLASRGAEIDSIFNLNATGTFIWEQIDGRRTGAEIARLVALDFQVSAEQAIVDCQIFLSQLMEARAIELVNVPSGVNG